jgi:hypothetical protein
MFKRNYETNPESEWFISSLDLVADKNIEKRLHYSLQF